MVYIGSAIDIFYRHYVHVTSLNSGKGKVNPHLKKDWDLYGEDNFVFTLVEECSKAMIKEREGYWIDIYNCIYPNGYNDIGPQGISESSRKKRSNAASKSMTGRQMPEEVKRKISESLKGRSKGKPSDETRRKMSEAAKRRVRKNVTDGANYKAREAPQN